MRRLFATASAIVLATAWACAGDEGPRANGDADAGDAGAIDSGDGRCSVDTRFDAPVLVLGFGEFEITSAHLSDDERRIVFSKIDGVDRVDDAGLERSALYEADRPATDAAFTNVRALSKTNAPSEDGPALTDDFLTIYFHSFREGRALPGHIYRATRASTADAFGEAVKMDGLDIETHRSSPHLARHAPEIWFNAADKSLAHRIYAAKLGANGLGETPEMARELSVSGLDATHAVLTADGLAIYWRASSLDASVSGGGDIWVGTRSSSEGPFEALRPVDELRSGEGEWPVSLSADRCRLYLVSDRASRRELYVAKRAP